MEEELKSDELVNETEQENDDEACCDGDCAACAHYDEEFGEDEDDDEDDKEEEDVENDLEDDLDIDLGGDVEDDK